MMVEVVPCSVVLFPLETFRRRIYRVGERRPPMPSIVRVVRICGVVGMLGEYHSDWLVSRVVVYTLNDCEELGCAIGGVLRKG